MRVSLVNGFRGTVSTGLARLTIVALAVSAGLMELPTAQAQQQPPVIVITPQPQVGTLDILRNQQQRQIYQERQRQSRDADRDMITRSTPRIEVPVMKPSCIPTGSSVVCR